MIAQVWRSIVYIYTNMKIKMINHSNVILNGWQHISSKTDVYVSDGGIITLSGISAFPYVHISAVGGNLYIGKHVFFNRNCIVVCRHKIQIDEGCIFGPNVMIYDHDHVFGSDGIIKEKFRLGTIVIEKGCWIGGGSIILRNTHIGKHSVVGAGTVVQGEIPAYSLITGQRCINIQKLH